MFNYLNKSLNNRNVVIFLSQNIRCLNTGRPLEAMGSDRSGPNDTKKKNEVKDVDYLGIFETSRKEISGLYDNEYDSNEVIEKYKDLTDSREKKMNEQNYLVTSFGKVRLDSDNVPKFHGQFEPNNDRTKFNINEFEDKMKNNLKDIKQSENQLNIENNIFEEQYFDALKDDKINRTDIPTADDCSSDSVKSDLGFIDKQFFSVNQNIKSLVKSKIDFKYKNEFNVFLEKKSTPIKSYINYNQNRVQNKINESNLAEEEFFNNKKSIPKKLLFESPLKSELFSQNFEPIIELKKNTTKTLDEEIEQKISEQKDIKLEELESIADKYKKISRTGAQYLEDLQSGRETPKYPKMFSQEVKDLRSELSLDLKGDKLDSKGYRILSGQVFDYTKFTHEDILRLLEQSILFDDNDIVAINKPYGMSIHSIEANNSPVLTDYLSELSERVNCEKLYTVHRLDRDTTGILLMTKTQEKAKQLNTMFAKHLINKRYLCITRGVPDDLEGVIDIPIDVGKCDGKERMVLRPEALEEYKNIIKPSRNAKRSVTQYKVVSENRNAALIEVWPQTGVRHQIRVHLGFGLRCPILGDHKYSHLDRIAPQKLTGDMLLALNVRQSKVRYIPLHLHAMQYCLPGAGIEGSNVFINAPLPHHFQKNMSKLRLRK